MLHAVVRANKYTAEDVVKLRTGVTRLMGIVAVANDTNDCKHHYHHICYLCCLCSYYPNDIFLRVWLNIFYEKSSILT